IDGSRGDRRFAGGFRSGLVPGIAPRARLLPLHGLAGIRLLAVVEIKFRLAGLRGNRLGGFLARVGAGVGRGVGSGAPAAAAAATATAAAPAPGTFTGSGLSFGI